MQEYIKVNKKAAEFIAMMGGNSATLSDAARAWMEMADEMKSHTTASLPALFGGYDGDRELSMLKSQFQAHYTKYVTSHHLLALFLDPRPQLRKFVRDRKLLGDSANGTLGNTPEVHAVAETLQTLSDVVGIPASALRNMMLAFNDVRLFYCRAGCRPGLDFSIPLSEWPFFKCRGKLSYISA